MPFDYNFLSTMLMGTGVVFLLGNLGFLADVAVAVYRFLFPPGEEL